MKKFGFGAMRLPLLNPENAASIDTEQLNRMVDAFLDAGFTYFDTAFPYHNQCSENAMKLALTDRHAREDFVFADKMPTVLITKAEEYPLYFEKQLEKTGLSYFDYYLLHNMGKDRYSITEKCGGFSYCIEQKKEGRIRNLGFSFHDDAELLDQILTSHPEVDFVQLQINYLDWEDPVIQSRKCYETARRHGKPIVIMEPVKGGTLAKLPEEAAALLHDYDPSASAASYALRFAAGLPGVMVVLSGMSNMAQLEENIKLMDHPAPLSGKEQKLLAGVVEIIRKNTAIPCTACGYCMEVCPKNIAIPTLFGLYNNYQVNGSFSNMYYQRAVFNHGRASDCIRCRRCEKNCPQHIAIPEQLELIKAFEK